ncbi:sulfite oxidase-like oxidoreductase [Salsipaludibacter albus]|uniref:sulfite oxidase-like oxidoreductase n=1 Tax=Salsipaludibacter albus TaxID=2849650 RepID=UPI001EE4B40D|nr:sulfite oxidase-like oxidoreductase [Salsipaludibacter albus]MBY5163641.1 sulfite oxidase-like oxidoreductase [Salsipaludibacter albus]
MSVTAGFGGRRGDDDERLPPGQYRVDDFPVLTAGPTPLVETDSWALTVRDDQVERTWSWDEFTALEVESVTTDIHCVTHWSKFDTQWAGVSVATLLDEAGVRDDAPYAQVYCYGGYTTNLPVEDLVDRVALVAHTFDGDPLEVEHGGPARLLVPHLYLWKSAKWIRGIRLVDHDQPGFWESAGYHNHGDPWLEQRYAGD